MQTFKSALHYAFPLTGLIPEYFKGAGNYLKL